jgi:hypothetical protein
MNQAAFICMFLLPAFAQDTGSGPPAVATPVSGEWRTGIDEVLAQPPAAVGTQDIQRLEEDLRLARPYFAAITPGDYEANREFIRRIYAYLAQVDTLTRNSRMRFALRRANQALVSIRLPGDAPQPAAPVDGRPDRPAPPDRPASGEPPFDLRAPVVENVADADAPKVRELRMRYESAAAQAVGAWQATDSIRANLADRGMALNPQTTASVVRIRLFLETAADALREHQWDDARDNIERAEYETQKVLKTMGR